MTTCVVDARTAFKSISNVLLGTEIYIYVKKKYTIFLIFQFELSCKSMQKHCTCFRLDSMNMLDCIIQTPFQYASWKKERRVLNIPCEPSAILGIASRPVSEGLQAWSGVDTKRLNQYMPWTRDKGKKNSEDQ